ncbi:MAG: cation:proton antiporter [Actinobacteria bacterium]|nr:cation:proton antiporter [Actinomycetota bacterium]
MTIIAVIVVVLLAAAIGLTLVRIVRGPSTLDRIVGTDVLLAITLGAIATEAAYTRDATGLPIMIGLALLGAIGSIAVGRFVDPAARVSQAASAGDEHPENRVPDREGQS